jgi:hypothetical protein
LRVSAYFTAGTEVDGIDVRVATLEQKGAKAPELLPQKEYPYTLSGSLSTFGRYDSESQRTVGETRLRTYFEYDDDGNYARGTFAAIQNHDSSEPTFHGSQARIEKRWDAGMIRGVFRDNLGSFNDPMQLFSDFKTEREKLGIAMEQSVGDLTAYYTVFDTENSVSNQEQGAAGRVTFGTPQKWLVGTSYTMRRGLYEDGGNEEKKSEHAASVDILFPLSDYLFVMAEGAGTEDQNGKQDLGYLLKGVLTTRSLKLSAGYIHLGEYYSAPFSAPLHGVDGDARGVDASIDYFSSGTLLFLQELSASVRFFSLEQPSDDENVNEIDGALRFGLGDSNRLFFSVYNREDDVATITAGSASLTHTWNSRWASTLQANYSDSESEESLRSGIDLRYDNGQKNARVGLEWLVSDLDDSAENQETSLRIDLSNNLWAWQLHGKYSDHIDEDGVNVFTRIDYTPVYLHRYNMRAYVAVGDRATLEFEERIECGLEVRF